MTFHRPCHRSPSPSIARVIAPASAHANGFHRPCHRGCSIPPHLCGDGSAALGLEGPRRSTTESKEGRMRAEGPRHQHVRSNAQNLEAPGVDRDGLVAIPSKRPVLQVRPSPVTVMCHRNSLPRVSRRQLTRLSRLGLLHFLPIGRCCKVTGTRRKGFSCVASHIPGSELVGTARSRPAKLRQNLKTAPSGRIEGHRRGAVGGVGGAGSSLLESYVFSLFRGFSGKTCALFATAISGAASEKFGRPSKENLVHL